MAKYVASDLGTSRMTRDEQSVLSGITFWKPEKPGTYYYRVLPPTETMINPRTGKASFFWGVPLHFGFSPTNHKTVFCPRRASKGELPCAICEFWLPFVRKDSTATAAEKAAAKDYLPNWRCYMNILLFDAKTGEPVREEDGSIKVRVFGPGNDIIDKTISALEELAEDLHEDAPDATHLTDPKAGRLVRLKREGTARDDTRYEVSLKKVLDITPYEEWWGDALVDLPQINPAKTPEQVAALMAGTPLAAADPFEAAPAGAKALSSPADADTVEGEYTTVSENAFGDDDDSEEEARPSKPAASSKRNGSAKEKLAALLD